MTNQWIGLIEVGLGVVGLIFGRLGRLSRGAYLVAVGLVVIGMSHLLPLSNPAIVTDIGGIVVLLGLGMTLGMVRRGRKDGENPPKGPDNPS